MPVAPEAGGAGTNKKASQELTGFLLALMGVSR